MASKRLPVYSLHKASAAAAEAMLDLRPELRSLEWRRFERASNRIWPLELGTGQLAPVIVCQSLGPRSGNGSGNGNGMAVSGRGNENATASVCVCDRLAARESERERETMQQVASLWPLLCVQLGRPVSRCLRLVCGSFAACLWAAMVPLERGSEWEAWAIVSACGECSNWSCD